MKLQSRLQISFLLLGTLSIAITGWQAYDSARAALERVTLDRLVSIRESKKQQVETWFRTKENQLVTLAENPRVVNAARDFIAAHDAAARALAGGVVDVAARYPALRAWYDSARAAIRSGAGNGDTAVFTPPSDPVACALQNALLPDSLPAALRQSPGALAAYLAAYDAHHAMLGQSGRRFGFDALHIIDARNGTAVYATGRGADLGRRIDADVFAPTALADAHRAALHAAPGTVHMTDITWYPAARNRPVAFLGVPLYNGDRMIATLIARITVDEINGIMTEKSNWENSGLGKSGETYLVGPDFTFRSDARFYLEQPAEYIAALLRGGMDSARAELLRHRSSTILLQEVNTGAAQQAMAGATGTITIDDYRRIPVVSSFTPIAAPDNHWVILAEIDGKEAFMSVYTLREKLIQAGLIILLCAAVIAVVISRSIAKPVRVLSRVAEQFGRGRFGERITITSHDEIGDLARTLNTMADNLMHRTSELEAEVAERGKAEDRVRESREQLRNLSSHIQTVREEERKGFAREVHDELGQALTALKLNLALVAKAIPTDRTTLHTRIRTMADLIDTTIRSVRRIITELRPGLLDDLGLTAAIEWQAEEFARRTEITCTVSQPATDPVLKPELAVSIFRIFQETLTNIARHAGATRVDVTLRESDGALDLVVHDNGRGIADEERDDPKSFGLLGIRERAHYWGGRAVFEGEKGKGTTVTVRIPLDIEEITP